MQVLLELAGLLVEPPLAAVDEVGGGPLRGEVDVQVLERVLGLARRLADVDAQDVPLRLEFIWQEGDGASAVVVPGGCGAAVAVVPSVPARV